MLTSSGLSGCNLVMLHLKLVADVPASIWQHEELVELLFRQESVQCWFLSFGCICWDSVTAHLFMVHRVSLCSSDGICVADDLMVMFQFLVFVDIHSRTRTHFIYVSAQSLSVKWSKLNWIFAQLKWRLFVLGLKRPNINVETIKTWNSLQFTNSDHAGIVFSPPIKL